MSGRAYPAREVTCGNSLSCCWRDASEPAPRTRARPRFGCGTGVDRGESLSASRHRSACRSACGSPASIRQLRDRDVAVFVTRETGDLRSRRHGWAVPHRCAIVEPPAGPKFRGARATPSWPYRSPNAGFSPGCAIRPSFHSPRCSSISTGQLPVDHWHEHLADPAGVADAIFIASGPRASAPVSAKEEQKNRREPITMASFIEEASRTT